MIGNKRKGDKLEEIINEDNINIIEEKAEEEKEIYISNKPLWIQDVKNSFKYFPLSIKELEFEKIEDMMNHEYIDSTIYKEDYPFYSTIKKVIYSFGDVREPNKKTILKISTFIDNYISLLIQIIQECDYKKIIEYLYRKEKDKFDSIKKFKHKSFFTNSIFNKKELDSTFFGAKNEDNNNILDLDESLDELKIYGNEEDKEEGKNIETEKDKINNINNIDKINYIDNIKSIENINNIDNLNKDFRNREDSYNSKKTKLNLFNLFCKEKDEINKEIAAFQDKRTELMDSKTYEEYIKCRQHNFLSRGKKYFLNFLQNFTKEDKFPCELKESNNIELIAFILNEEIKKIITKGIKNKHPNKKLFILTQPLTPEDIDNFCNNEIQILSNFLNSFHNDIFMINEFKKKKNK